jgi:hypothetical protein
LFLFVFSLLDANQRQVQEFETAEKVQMQLRLLEQDEAETAASLNLVKPRRLSAAAMEVREKALREMVELEQRSRELGAIEARQISELEAAQQELQRTKQTAETAREVMRKAMEERNRQQVAQQKVRDAALQAEYRIQAERDSTLRAEQRRCAQVPAAPHTVDAGSTATNQAQCSTHAWGDDFHACS